MPSASGQRTALRFTPEATFGVPASTAYKALRFTSTGLNLSKANYQSNEIRADRHLSDLRHGMVSVGGDIGVELSLGTFDDLLEAALSGTWATATTGSVSLAADAATGTLVRTAGSFLADGFLPGDQVLVSGFAEAANNGRARVEAVTALALTVDRELEDDVAAAGRTVALVGRRLKSGTVLKTFSFERAFTDINQYALYRGCAVDSLKLSIKPEEIITGTFALLGKDMQMATATHAATVTPPGTNSPFDAFTGSLREGGQLVANVTSLDLDITNGRSTKGVIGQRSATEIHEGGFGVSGTLSAYFMGQDLLAKFLDEAESSLEVVLQDVNGTDFHTLRIPRLKYTGGELDNPKEGPVQVSMPFTALLDATSGASILYQRSNA
ncbi:phage tail tube protein [Corallococcus sp. bb12-1]|uniref:phage tail tube protein n=1 Tax=Corallococcus sp. bb12-1 TaxID=2996784 RepID=UPI00226D5E53|nr:phage tail tube protein [Corallococcus sp. bb12-1]MCY1042713.1 phage tail tube protein [Corallococcus sp. bb12-1]